MSQHPLRRLAIVSAVAALALGLASCSSAGTSGSSSAALSDSELDTVTPGVLTIATSEPAYSPYVEDDDPTTGEGFESAVAYAVAEKLGYSADEVEWVREDFDASITPGAKDWDLNIQQFSITDERKQAVDFSSPYYTATQAVVTYAGSPADGATSIADLTSVKFGVQAATTSLTTLQDAIAPEQEISQFNSNADAIAALKNKQVDAIVLDLPTAIYEVNVDLDDGVIVGQLESDGDSDQFGIVLPKDSSLTDAVTEAVDELQADGTLDALAQTWLNTNGVSIPFLQ